MTDTRVMVTRRIFRRAQDVIVSGARAHPRTYMSARDVVGAVIVYLEKCQNSNATAA